MSWNHVLFEDQLAASQDSESDLRLENRRHWPYSVPAGPEEAGSTSFHPHQHRDEAERHSGTEEYPHNCEYEISH